LLFIVFIFIIKESQDWKLKGGSLMSKVQIKVNDNGSLRITGEVELIDGEGNVFETKPTFSLCRCGMSNNKPFCDGSHKGKFESAVRAPKQD
jgi:CDGSH iron-sulfur domain-containing protein 3